MAYSIIIPAYNEEKSIGAVLAQITDLISDDVEIIVVDDCSTDDTVRVVGQFPAVKIIQHTENKGQTEALLTGFQAADYDVLVTLDADGQHPVSSIHDLVKPILNNEADLVLGVRSKLPRFGEKIIAIGAGVTDATTGFKALHRQCIPFYDGDNVYGGMLIVKSKVNHLRVKEVPIDVRERMAGTSFHSDFDILKKALIFWISSLFKRL